MSSQIIGDWIKEDIELNGPASEEEFQCTEFSIGFNFPEDFKDFYKKCNGFKVWQMDSKMLSLWPMNKIKADYNGSDFIGFADYNVNGSEIGFLRTKGGIYKSYDRSLVCQSFNGFLDHWQKETGKYI
jgi:hypothetical protein